MTSNQKDKLKQEIEKCAFNTQVSTVVRLSEVNIIIDQFPDTESARPEPKFEVGQTVRFITSHGDIFTIEKAEYKKIISDSEVKWVYSGGKYSNWQEELLELRPLTFGDCVRHEEYGYGNVDSTNSDGSIFSNFRNTFIDIQPNELEFVAKSNVPEDK